MRLNLTSPIKFGYNPQYHEQLHKNLASRQKDKAYAQQLIEADSFTLKLEDEIIEMEEKKKANTLAYRNLTNLLLDLKNDIALHMSATFGTQKYCESLIDTYQQEAELQTNENARGWRENLVLDLIDYLPPKKAQSPYTDDLFMESYEEGFETQKAENTATKDTAKKDEIENIITQHKPTPSSPKGFVDVMGAHEQKKEFEEEIITYLKQPELAKLDEEEYGIRAPRGYLFYGPPGCGKTFMAEALAAESGLDMYKMDVSKTGSKFINESSNNIQVAFDFLAKTSKEQNKPVLLFMDEVDSLALGRDKAGHVSPEDLKVVTTLLKSIEKARDEGIIVIAATNKYDLLDDAFVARFDGQKYFGLPNQEEIAVLLKHSLAKRSKGVNLANNEEEIKQLSKELLGHSNRSVVFIVDSAAKMAKRNNRSEITAQDIRKIISTTELQKVDESKFKKQEKVSKNIGFV